MQNSTEKKPLLSIVMPCLNEQHTLATCIEKARSWIELQDFECEIVIGDNGSTDGSIEIAEKSGVRLVHIAEKGYGSALFHATQAAQGQYIIMADSDNSYDFSNLTSFWEKLQDGFDLVVGNRFLGGIEPGAMPWKNRLIGNPVLSFLGALFFKSTVHDFHCGIRGFSKTAFKKWKLNTRGMEYASEMIVKSSLMNMRVTEVPTTLSKDGRDRSPHLRPWRDGWRHLIFMLLFAPKWLFWYPGLMLSIFGTGLFVWLIPEARIVGLLRLDIHTLLFAAVFIVIGYQAITFDILLRKVGISIGVTPSTMMYQKFQRHFDRDKFILFGILVSSLGILGMLSAIVVWGYYQFGSLNPSETMRLAIPSCLFTIIGFQTIFFSLLIEFINLNVSHSRHP